MQKYLSYINNVTNNPKTINNFGCIRALLVCLLSFCSVLGYAQENDTIKRSSSTTIVLRDGAKIFSKDESFNKQVLDKKIIIKNSDVLYQENSPKSNSLQAVAKKPTDEKTNLKKQLKAAEDSKQK